MTSQMWMILITVVYVCAMMLLSWIIGKKTTKDETEFMVGGREFTAFMTAIGNGSILISGGYLPSIIMYGYMFGMGGMWFYLGWGTGALVAWLCWAGFWRTSGALTPTEWFEYRYGKGGRMAITIVILFASLAILGWQYVGCGETIGGALGIDPKIAMLLVGVAVTAYVVFGGIWAATATDVIQFSWVFIIQFIILPTFLIAKYGLPDAVALPDAFLSLPFGTLPVIKFVAPSVITFLMMHQSLLNQSPYWARAAGTRSLKNCKRGWMWTVIIAYFTGVVGAFIGCYARQLLPGLTDSSQAFGALMNILPIPLAACIMAGLMAATMSTCDIYLVSGVNQLVRDVAQYFLKIRDTKKLLQWAKWGHHHLWNGLGILRHLLERRAELSLRFRHRSGCPIVCLLSGLLAIAGRQPEGSDCLCCRVYGHCTVLGYPNHQLPADEQPLADFPGLFPHAGDCKLSDQEGYRCSCG